MDKPDLCTLCCEVFGKELRPRVLPCGHTYCTDCLQKLIINRRLACPECQRSHKAFDVTEIPVNFTLENMIAKTNEKESSLGICKEARTESFIKGKIMMTLLSEQTSNAQDLLQLAEEMTAQIDEYDVYLVCNAKRNQDAAQKMRAMALKHETTLSDIAEERKKLEEMRNEVDVYTRKLKDSLTGLDNALTPTSDISETLALAKVVECCGDAAKRIDRCQENFPSSKITYLIKEITESLQILESTESARKGTKSYSVPSKKKLTIVEKLKSSQGDGLVVVNRTKHNLQVLKAYFLKQVIVTDTKDGQHRSAKISVNDDKIYLHHLEETTEQPSPYAIKHGDVISSCLNQESTVAFLDLFWDGSIKGRVHVLLCPDTPLARHFRILCTGDFGPSYAHTKFFEVRWQDSDTEAIVGGDYKSNSGYGGAAVLEDIDLDDEVYSRRDEKGAIWTNSRETRCNHGQFFINMGKGNSDNYDAIFGKVQDGMDVLENAVRRIKNGKGDVKVVDCGVVLSL